jgi:hypothetical protein
MVPGFDLDAIKFGTDSATFERAIGLYESGKVTEFKSDSYKFSALVLGSKPYRVSVNIEHYDRGMCECYLGQTDTLCKHMVAVAIHAVKKGKPLSEHDKERIDRAICSGKLGTLSAAQLSKTKSAITDALRYIKSYTGPSRTWFAYQDSLSEGCARLAAIISNLPVSAQTAKLLVDLLLRIERKLMGGVDDSDEAVGECMTAIVEVLQEYAELDHTCICEFAALQKLGNTSLGWEEPLVKLLE